jgi:hypothetical protein
LLKYIEDYLKFANELIQNSRIQDFPQLTCGVR